MLLIVLLTGNRIHFIPEISQGYTNRNNGPLILTGHQRRKKNTYCMDIIREIVAFFFYFSSLDACRVGCSVKPVLYDCTSTEHGPTRNGRARTNRVALYTRPFHHRRYEVYYNFALPMYSCTKQANCFFFCYYTFPDHLMTIDNKLVYLSKIGMCPDETGFSCKLIITNDA